MNKYILYSLITSSLVLTVNAFAQSSEQSLKLDQLKRLASAVENQGLKSNWYINDSFNQQLNSALTNINPNAVDLLIANVADQVAKDLSLGRVSPNNFADKVRIPTKEYSPIHRQYVQLYLSDQMSLQQLVQQVSPKNIYYQQSLKAYQHLLKISQDGSWAKLPAKTKLDNLKIGTQNPSLISFLRQRLANLGYVNDITSTQFDLDLNETVMQFQEDYNLVVDGVVGAGSWRNLNQDLNQLMTQSMMNLDRSRWLPDSMPSEYIFVNLAGQRFTMFQNSQMVLNFKTINGRVDRQTPLLVDSVKNIVLNPTWTVPFSIFVKDKLPELQKDPGYVERLNMKVIDDLTGQEVSTYSVNWLTEKPEDLKYTLVQRPGPGNALGFIKFPLQNPYAIYLHDTDSRQLFDQNPRLFSSGCVRLHQPFELAEKLLENPKWTADTLRTASEFNTLSNVQPQWLKTKRTVPVYLFYQTLFAQDNNRIIILPDAYSLDAAAYSRLTGK